jgi:hypothetical protein
MAQMLSKFGGQKPQAGGGGGGIFGGLGAKIAQNPEMLAKLKANAGGGGLLGKVAGAIPAGAGMASAPAAKNAATSAAGAMGGWNANPQFAKQAANFIKSGAELAPEHRAAMGPLLRNTDPSGAPPAPRTVQDRGSGFNLSEYMGPAAGGSFASGIF